MQFRFRYLGPDAKDIEIESIDALRALMKSGKVAELTLLYDVLTREWAPARSHAVYRLLREEMESAAAPPSPPAPPSMAEKPRGSRAPRDDQLPDLGLTLSIQTPANPDTERTIRALLREREQEGQPTERVQSFATPSAWAPTATPSKPPLPFVKPQAPPANVSAPPAKAPEPPAKTPAPPAIQRPAYASDLELIPPPPLDPPRPAPVKAAPPPLEALPLIQPPPPDPRPAFVRSAPPIVETPPRATPAPVVPRRVRTVHLDLLQKWLNRAADEVQLLVGHRSVPSTMMLGGLMGLLLLLFVAVRTSDRVNAPTRGPTSEMIVATTTAGPDLSELVARSALARASGFQNMLAGMDSLRQIHNVAEVPAVWLEGVYLADARRFPEVEEFWLRYQEFLQDVEASDTALFRGGFVQQVADEGESDAVLSMRLSRAMREFKDSQPERAAVYDEMEDLAGAALALHGLLVERADDIEFDPAIQLGISREPVVEAVAQDTVLHDRMWSLLERIFASLEKLGGNLGGTRDNLTDMLLQGVQATGK